MRVTVRRLFPSLLMLAGLFLTGAVSVARADEALDEARRKLEVARQKMEADAAEALAEARKLSSSNPSKAVEILKQLLPTLEADKALSELRRKTLLDNVKARIREYEAIGKVPTERQLSDAQRAAIARARREREEEEAAKNDHIARTQWTINNLKRQGKYEEARRLNDQLTSRYGSLPTTTANTRTANISQSLAELRQLKDERNRRYLTVMADVVRSSMPVMGEIEFPRDWAEKTKRRMKLTQPQLTEKEKSLLRALNKPISAEFKNRTLQEVLDYFERASGITFTIDKSGLDEAGVTYETPINATVKTTTRTALKKILGELGLSFVIDKETIYVSTPAKLRDKMVTRAYYIGDLASILDFRFPAELNLAATVEAIATIINLIQNSIEPDTWKVNGGNGTIFFQPSTMSIVVKQSAEVHYMLSGALR